MKKELLGVFILGSFAFVGCQKDEVAAPAELSTEKLLHKDVLGEKDLGGGGDSTVVPFEAARMAPTSETEKSGPAKATPAVPGKPGTPATPAVPANPKGK